MIWLWLSAALMLVTAAAHSTLSETQLMPMIASTGDGWARTIFRFALHAMTVFMLLSAISVPYPGVPRELIAVIGTGWLLVGIAALVSTRGRHKGWPVIAGAGATALIGAFA